MQAQWVERVVPYDWHMLHRLWVYAGSRLVSRGGGTQSVEAGRGLDMLRPASALRQKNCPLFQDCV